MTHLRVEFPPNAKPEPVLAALGSLQINMNHLRFVKSTRTECRIWQTYTRRDDLLYEAMNYVAIKIDLNLYRSSIHNSCSPSCYSHALDILHRISHLLVWSGHQPPHSRL